MMCCDIVIFMCCFDLLLLPSLPLRLFHSAGAGRTGTFCALSTVLERVKAEGILDVFQTVKSLRLQRPHMVQTLVRPLVMLWAPWLPTKGVSYFIA